jgi:peptidoglycan hydrolase FlgJ
MNFAVPPVGLSSLEMSGLTAPGLPLNVMGKAYSLEPALASQAVDQVVLGQSGISHLTKSLSPGELNPLSGMASHSDSELRQVSKNFESIFLQMVFKEMRNSVEKSDLFGNTQGMEFFESMRDQALTEQLANAGGIGLGQMVYQRLKQVTVPHQKTFA